MDNIIIKHIQFMCRHCGKECILEWPSYFEGALPAAPKYCPWCGKVHEGEIKWDEKS